MKNDKQIAFTQLSSQPFSGKFVKIIQCLKLISWNVCIRILDSWDTCIFAHDQICNHNHDYSWKYWKMYHFSEVN